MPLYHSDKLWFPTDVGYMPILNLNSGRQCTGVWPYHVVHVVHVMYATLTLNSHLTVNDLSTNVYLIISTINPDQSRLLRAGYATR